jgi:hypothetical protein
MPSAAKHRCVKRLTRPYSGEPKPFFGVCVFCSHGRAIRLGANPRKGGPYDTPAKFRSDMHPLHSSCGCGGSCGGYRCGGRSGSRPRWRWGWQKRGCRDNGNGPRLDWQHDAPFAALRYKLHSRWNHACAWDSRDTWGQWIECYRHGASCRNRWLSRRGRLQPRARTEHVRKSKCALSYSSIPKRVTERKSERVATNHPHLEWPGEWARQQWSALGRQLA